MVVEERAVDGECRWEGRKGVLDLDWETGLEGVRFMSCLGPLTNTMYVGFFFFYGVNCVMGEEKNGDRGRKVRGVRVEGQ